MALENKNKMGFRSKFLGDHHGMMRYDGCSMICSRYTLIDESSQMGIFIGFALRTENADHSKNNNSSLCSVHEDVCDR